MFDASAGLLRWGFLASRLLWVCTLPFSPLPAGEGKGEGSQLTGSVLSFRNVSKIYESSGGGRRVVLRDVSIDVAGGRKVALVGRSGSGKSTFLHLAAGIDLPTEGEICLLGRDLAGLSERARTLQRRDAVGLIFQFFYLLPHLNVHDNVALPELIAGGRPADFEGRVRELLERVGLEDRAEDHVQRLSGGEMQRVAICRALLRRPRLILADEPTGNLDDVTARAVMDLLLQLVSEAGSTLICVTHDRDLAALADETWHLHSGILEAS
ncbi:MAG: ABC transporter ATP-binding protein [Candidatus Latescibacteria bacterium]|nr:ABC transporter ATP-binding protein [Candidatus Latescibacterota bacterium]